MKKDDLIPACLQLIQDNPKFRRLLKSALPSEAHEALDAVVTDGLFLPNGMMSQVGHAFIKQLNASLPVVQAALESITAATIKKRASLYRAGVEVRRASHTKTRQATSPSLLKRARSLARAVSLETMAIARRRPNLTPEQVAARLAICGSCDQLRSNRTCAKCGCFVEAKARFRSQVCPLRKWPVV